jgi:hypothetical protein
MKMDRSDIASVAHWIEQKKIDTVNEIVALKHKLTVYDMMLKDLGTARREPLPQDRVPTELSKGQEVDALLALEAAGPAGLSAAELSDLTGMPRGTASSKLSILKSKGRATHRMPKYFAVHSTQEDNNNDNGMEAVN